MCLSGREVAMNPSAGRGQELEVLSLCFQLLLSLQPFRGDQRMLEQGLIPDLTEMFCYHESGLKMCGAV